MNDFHCWDRGYLKLGVPPQIGAALIPDLLPEFTRLYPKLHLSVMENGSPSTLYLVETGEIDVGFSILLAASSKLETYKIRQEPILLCVAPQHPLSNRKQVDFAELRNEKFILRKADSFHRELVLNLCRKNGYAPNVVLTSNQIQTIRSLVAKNFGIAFFMESVVKNDPGIIAIPLTESLSVPIGLSWRKENYLSVATKVFIDFVKTKYTTTPQKSNWEGNFDVNQSNK